MTQYCDGGQAQPLKVQEVGEYGQIMSQSRTTDQPMSQQGRVKER